MAGNAVEAGKAYVEISAQDKVTKVLDQVAGKLKSIGEAASEVGKKMVIAGGAAAAAFVGATKVFAEIGDSIAKAATQTGIAAGTLSELSYAAGQSGTDLEGLEKAIVKLSKNVVEAANGSATATEAFGNLGLSAKDLIALSPDEQFKAVADAISRIANPTEKAAAAMDVFGKSGASLIPLMADGRAGIEALQAAARDLGVTFSTDDARAAEEFGDRLDDLTAVAKAAVFQLGAALAPAVRAYALEITGGISAVVKWVKENRDTVTTYGALAVKAAAYTAAIGATAFALGKIVAVAGTVISAISKVTLMVSSLAALKGAVIAAGAAIAANPLTLAVVGIGALAAATAGLYAFNKAKGAIEASKLIETGAQKIAEDAAEARNETLGLIQTLEQLNGKSRLNDADTVSAQAAIAALTKRYGDLGIGIDQTTGKLTGFIDGLKQVEAAETQLEIKRQLAIAKEAADNQTRLQARMQALVPDTESANYGVFTLHNAPKAYAAAAQYDALSQRQADERDKQDAATARLRELRKQQKQTGTSDVFKDAKAAPKPAADPDDVEGKKNKAKEAAADRKRLDDLAKQARKEGLTDEQRKLEEINDRYNEQLEIIKKLYAEAEKGGDRSGMAKLANEASAAYRQAMVDAEKVRKEAKDKRDKDAADAKKKAEDDAKDLLDKEQQKQLALLRLQEQAAEKAGDAKKQAAIKKQIENAEFERSLRDTFGNDEKAKAQARSLHKAVQDQPQIKFTSQGSFDVRGGAGQALQGAGVQDRIAKATEDTAKNTKAMAKSKGTQLKFR